MLDARILTQVLDTVSFVLVTPEFIGATRLVALRAKLSHGASAIRKWVFGFDETKVLFREAAPMLLGLPAVAAPLCLLFIEIFRSIASIPAYGALSVAGIALGVAVLLVVGLFVASIILIWSSYVLMLLLYLLAIGSVRAVLFAVGSLLFFSSRALSIWVVWSPK